MHFNAHIVNHVNDVFDLFRVNDIVGQVVIDLVIRQKALFLSFRNQQFPA